jgi:hypothetical protein
MDLGINSYGLKQLKRYGLRIHYSFFLFFSYLKIYRKTQKMRDESHNK